MLDGVDEYSKADVVTDLKKKYPLSIRRIVRDWLPWGVSYALLLAFLEYVTDQSAGKGVLEGTTEVLLDVSLVLMIAGFVLVVGKLVYEILFHITAHYQIEDNHLAVSLGVLLKRRSTIPLSLISDVSLNRNVLSLMFGLYNVFVTTPGGEDTHAVVLRGLKTKHAVALQNHLSKLVHRAKQGVDPMNDDNYNLEQTDE